MTPSASKLLLATTLVVRKGPFALGAWDLERLSAVFAGVLRARCPMAAVICDDLEVTALVAESALVEFPPPLRVEGTWAILTLDTVMAWDVVGVLAKFTRVLAAAGVPAGALSAYSRDHFLVQAEHLDVAIEKLATVVKAVNVVD
jgi:hypothetical protein